MDQSPSTSSSGILPKVCIFCSTVYKSLGKGKRESLGNCEVPESGEGIKAAAFTLQDDIMTTKLVGLDFIAKEVKYHHSCRRSYLRKAERIEEQLFTERSETTIMHEDAFSSLQKYNTTTLIDNDGAELLTSLHSRYMSLLGSNESTYPARSLCTKILNSFRCTLKKIRKSSNTGLIIYNTSLSEESAIRKASYDENGIREKPHYTFVH